MFVYTIKLQAQQLWVLLPALTDARSPWTAAIRCSSLKHEATVKVRRIALWLPPFGLLRPASSTPARIPSPIGGCRYCSCLLPQTEIQLNSSIASDPQKTRGRAGEKMGHQR